MSKEWSLVVLDAIFFLVIYCTLRGLIKPFQVVCEHGIATCAENMA